jgi:hypothetical protein
LTSFADIVAFLVFVGCCRGTGGASGHDAEDVAFLHDKQLFTVDGEELLIMKEGDILGVMA